jgi:hypothetical protein
MKRAAPGCVTTHPAETLTKEEQLVGAKRGCPPALWRQSRHAGLQGSSKLAAQIVRSRAQPANLFFLQPISKNGIGFQGLAQWRDIVSINCISVLSNRGVRMRSDNETLEAISKPHLRSNFCVARRLKMLTYYRVCSAFSSPRALILNLI